jgi:hypothetical protein
VDVHTALARVLVDLLEPTAPGSRRLFGELLGLERLVRAPRLVSESPLGALIDRLGLGVQGGGGLTNLCHQYSEHLGEKLPPIPTGRSGYQGPDAPLCFAELLAQGPEGQAEDPHAGVGQPTLLHQATPLTVGSARGCPSVVSLT